MTKSRHFFFPSKSRRFSMAIPNKKRKRKEVRRKDEEIQTDNLLKPQVIDKDASISNVVDDSKPLSKFDLHLQHKLCGEDTRYRGMQINLNKDKLSSTIANDDGSKDKLITSKVNQENGGLGSEDGEPISNEQIWFFDQCSTYRDILFANKTPFYLEDSEDVEIRGAYIVHALNHVFRTRDCIDKNDAEIAEIGADVDIERFQDQGFTRPKVLILLPFASIMYDVVMSLIKLTPSAEVDEESLKLFSDKYGGEEQKDSKEKGQEPDNEDPKPEDFKLLFKGNSDEKFITGIQFTGTTIKLSDDLFSSDFIIASPRRLVDEIDVGNVDILSSIEILIIDHADIIAMQDWSHVNTIIQQLNRVPDELPNATMRIRPWYLEEEAQFYRQTMILGSYSNKDILESFNRSSNYEGKMMRLMSEYKGVNEWFSKLSEMDKADWNVISNFDVPQWFYETLQVFVRFTKILRDVDVDVDVDDVDVDVARHDYFVERIFPRIKDSDKGGIMIFTSSHSESIKILEFLRSERASVYLVGDEDAELDFSSARRQFSERKIKIMLYTEKSHFDNRYQIDGVNYLIMYSLPERKEFYFEILKMLAKSENMACTALFSRLDKYRLLGIVGTELANFLLFSDETITKFIK